MAVVTIAAKSAGTGAALGAAAVLIVIPIVLLILVAPLQRKRYRSGRRVRFASSDRVVHEGTIIGSGKLGRIRVRDGDGTEYELRATRVRLL
jgi:hypothetical protein